MSDDVQTRKDRIVGGIEALDHLAVHTPCMPNDRRTADLLDAIRMLTSKAMASALEYSGEK